MFLVVENPNRYNLGRNTTVRPLPTEPVDPKQYEEVLKRWMESTNASKN